MSTTSATIETSNNPNIRDEEYMLQFWKPKITDLILKVYDGRFITKSEIIRDFTLHFAKPIGLESIIDELVQRKDLVTVESILD